MKKIILAIACLLLVTKTYAQTGNSLLWQISGNGLKSSSYLFGTYHLAGRSLVDSLPEIKARFNTCKTVVGEMVMDSTMLIKLLPHMMAADSATLDKIFSHDEYQQIVTCINDLLHIDADRFNHFKPSAVATMLAALASPNTTSANNPAIDMYFQQEGKRRSENVIGLETLEQQAEFLLGSPMDVQKKQLLAVVKKKDTMRKTAMEMYQMYLHQDLDGLKNLLEKDDDTTPDQKDKLLKDRNQNWMTQLPGIMQQQPTFIAVGAGHLVGDYGLIKQLRLKGYKVKAVKI